MRLLTDWPLLAILAGLGLSLGLFLADLVVYPFGILILAVLLVARLLYLRRTADLPVSGTNEKIPPDRSQDTGAAPGMKS